MFTWTFFLAAGFALLDWASTWKGWKKRLYVAKPATLFFLILWSFTVTGWQGEMKGYGAALVFSLIGDIFLLLNPRYFLYGLGAFFFTHLFYIIALNSEPVQFEPLLFLPLLVVIVLTTIILHRLKPAIIKAPKGKRLWHACSIYALALALMVLSAWLSFFRPTWSFPAISYVSIGALFFLVSDFTLTYDRFVKKINHGQSLVHLTYHLGQFLILTGAVTHFLA